MAYRTISLIFLPGDFVSWLTDITNPRLSDCGSETGWFFAGQLDGKLTLSDLRGVDDISFKQE